MVEGNQGVPYCSLCAWRKDCKLKFRYQGDTSLFCKEYTRDLGIKIGERVDAEEEGTGRDD
jgi:hypothetical protein